MTHLNKVTNLRSKNNMVLCLKICYFAWIEMISLRFIILLYQRIHYSYLIIQYVKSENAITTAKLNNSNQFKMEEQIMNMFKHWKMLIFLHYFLLKPCHFFWSHIDLDTFFTSIPAYMQMTLSGPRHTRNFDTQCYN